MRKVLFSLTILLLGFAVQAQQSRTLSYAEALTICLKNNFDVLIAKNSEEAARLQNTIGNAGMLPRLSLSAIGSKSQNNTQQNFSSGLTVNQDNVKSSALTSGAYLSWTVFDGLKMFATKERLRLLEEQGRLNFRLQMELAIEQMTIQYYQVVKQEQLIRGILAAMSVSEERIKIAETKLQLGSGSNVELLQAKLDKNAQRSDLVTQRYLLNDFKLNLMTAIGTQPDTNFTVDTGFTFAALPSPNFITEQTLRNNTSVLLAQNSALALRQSFKELRAQNLPRLDLTSGYVFTRNANAAGFTLLNQNLGFNYGFSFNWNVFNGFSIRRQAAAAKLQYASADILTEKTKVQNESAAKAAYARWLGDRAILDIEEENITLALQSMHITTERMKLGLGNYLEVKESQSSYEEAVTRLVNARFNLKQSETLLRRLSGTIIEDATEQ